MSRYEKAIKALNEYQHGYMTAEDFLREYGYIAIEALHKADMESKDEKAK
jgi:hypothetical protein